jgi:hypothetical protein
MAATRCKFSVNKIEFVKSSKPVLDENGQHAKDEKGTSLYETFKQPTVHLGAIYAPDDPQSENGRFWTATPSGSIALAINNPVGAEVFDVGEDYYVTFEKVGSGEE